MAKAALDHRLDQARASAKESRRPFPKPGTPSYLQIRGQLIQFLVQRAQVAEDAEERGIEVSNADVEQRRKDLVRQYFGGDETLYERQLRENGIPGDQARADVEAMLIQEALVAEVGKDIEASEAEVRKYYAKNRRNYKSSPYAKVRKAVRAALLEQKRLQATARYLAHLARKHEVRYQVGFEPKA